MITRAMPSLNITSTNMVPLSFIYTTISLAGVILILCGITGILYLIWRLARREKEVV
jgi:uncharacterized membrane protein YesL